MEASEEALGKRLLSIAKANRRSKMDNWTAKEDIFDYKTAKTVESKERYVEQRNLTNQRLREIKESCWESFVNSMESDMHGKY